ncbi:MAG: pantoate--beta-alanine ligase [Parvularculaceae bacterium]
MTSAAVDSQLEIVRSVAALRRLVAKWRQNGDSIAFAPTMGALHDGHMSLIHKANTVADRTVASIYVNPAQFAPHEDFSSYPRSEDDDLARLAAAGCDLAYLPDPSEMYPPGFQTSITIGEVSHGLCGASRPHFFGGVAIIVCKLLNQVAPDYAIFGEKDYQQLLVIRRMVRDLDMPVEIVGAPIVREADGLAMSSRNAYLNDAERQTAGHLNRVIASMASDLENAGDAAEITARGKDTLMHAGFSAVDYLEVRNAETLAPFLGGPVDKPARVFAAAIIGKTRLIDNWPVNPPARA